MKSRELILFTTKLGGLRGSALINALNLDEFSRKDRARRQPELKAKEIRFQVQDKKIVRIFDNRPGLSECRYLEEYLYSFMPVFRYDC